VALLYAGDRALELRRVRDVELDRFHTGPIRAQCRDRGFEPLLIDVRERHHRAPLDEHSGERAADARSRTGDHRNFVAKRILHRAILAQPSAEFDKAQKIAYSVGVPRSTLALASLALLIARTASADELPRIAFERYTLDNGLTVILHVDRWQPLVSINIWYGVGALDQKQGKTGLAHLFEHLMFESTAHIGTGQVMRELERAGATDYNGRTYADHTEYYETVPSNEIELALWLESDRMGFLLEGLTEERLENQKRVVKNELLQRVQDEPYGQVDRQIVGLIYPAGHPLHDGIGGAPEDIDSASLASAREFFRAYYSPANATLVIAGDIDPEDTKALVRSYFGGLRGAAKIERGRVTSALITPMATTRVAENIARRGRITLLWPGPALLSEDAVDLDVFAYILSQSRVTRVSMVNFKERSIESIDASLEDDQSGTFFRIDAQVAPGLDFELAKLRVTTMLRSYRDIPPTEDEVYGAWNTLETRTVAALQKNGGGSGRAHMLNFFQCYFGDPGKLGWFVQRWRRATPFSVRKAIDSYLSKPPMIVYAEAARSRP
jgi:zinc protease